MWPYLGAALILIVFGPVVGVLLGLNAGILPLVGIACALVGVVRHAPVLRRRTGAPSPGAEKDAKVLSNYVVDRPPEPEIRITDI